VARSITKANNGRKSANHNEYNNGNPALGVRGIKIRVSHWMAGVEKERPGYQSSRDRNRHPRIYAIRIGARHSLTIIRRKFVKHHEFFFV